MLLFEPSERADFLTVVDNPLFKEFDTRELATFYGQQFDLIKLEISQKIEREVNTKQKQILKLSQQKINTQQSMIPSTNELKQSI